MKTKKKNIPICDFYYDMKYNPSYATFENIPAGMPPFPSLSSFYVACAIICLTFVFMIPLRSGDGASDSEVSSSALSSEETSVNGSKHKLDSRKNGSKATASLLDLYSGCGAMSTGLCLGAQLSGLNLESVRGSFI